MSRSLVKRVSRIVDHHASRRRFLRSSAMAATAMAVAPIAFAVRPVSAEAAIRNCKGHRCAPGALCCDGWTEFCCQLTGENTCPPGTVVAGWWKVDDSDFCSLGQPRPRYYFDCNLVCDPGCGCNSRGLCSKACTSARCHCPGGCATRKVDCARFRYGQCNQDVCVGPVKCRVVTCVPPWQWDPKCSAAPVLRSEATRTHDRPCLHVGFTDVPPLAFYAKMVEWTADEGIIAGLTDDLFGPDELVQRAQFADFLWSYEGKPSAALSSYFHDVPTDSTHASAVAWMLEQGLTRGMAPRRFEPESLLTMAQAIVFLHRLADPPSTSSSPFTQAAGDTWYAKAFDWAVKNDIIWWSPPLKFEPDRPVSRGLAADFLYRFHLSRNPGESSADAANESPRVGSVK